MKKLIAIILWFSLALSGGATAGTTENQTYLESLWSSASSAVFSTLALAQTKSDTVVGGVGQADPFEAYNRWMFRFNSELDEKALRPLAEKYREHTPEVIKSGVSNFFSNLGDVGVVTNSVLQGKFDQAFNDTTRLVINSIAGIGGVVDVATMLNYEKNHEDFGQTFGVWGIPEGPYIVLPVLGPRTVRSAIGTALDTYLQVETLGAFSEAAAGQDLVTEMLSLNLIQQRSEALDKTALIEQAALDPYIFTREAYLTYRRCQVTDCDRVNYVPAKPESGNEGPDELDLLDQIE